MNKTLNKLLIVLGILAADVAAVCVCTHLICARTISEYETNASVNDTQEAADDDDSDGLGIAVQYSTIIVNDLDESVAFYRDVLGFTEGYHVELGNGSAITIMNSEGASVELIDSDNYDIGMYSIGTDVEDLDKVLEVLEANGYEPITPIVETTVGRQTFILDPNSVRICLIEHSQEYKEEYMK